MLQILNFYLLNLNSEFWSNLTLWCLSHESGMIVSNFDPKIPPITAIMAGAHQIPKIPAEGNSCLFACFRYVSFVIFELSNWGLFIWVTLDRWTLSVESSFSNWIDWVQFNVKKDRRSLKAWGRFCPKKTRPRQLCLGPKTDLLTWPIGQKQRQKPFHNCRPAWQLFTFMLC